MAYWPAYRILGRWIQLRIGVDDSVAEFRPPRSAASLVSLFSFCLRLPPVPGTRFPLPLSSSIWERWAWNSSALCASG